MFGPIVSAIGEKKRGMSSKGFSTLIDTSIHPPQQWIFPTIDIWPTEGSSIQTLSEFTPVVGGQAYPLQDQADSTRPTDFNRKAYKGSYLQMTEWMRPLYSADWGAAGVNGVVSLEIRVDGQGVPADINIVSSSGHRELDESALSAARSWRFATPIWNSQPMGVSVRVNLNYHSN